MIGGDGEREGAVGGRDDHTVTIGLLDKALVALYQACLLYTSGDSMNFK